MMRLPLALHHTRLSLNFPMATLFCSLSFLIACPVAKVLTEYLISPALLECFPCSRYYRRGTPEWSRRSSVASHASVCPKLHRR